MLLQWFSMLLRCFFNCFNAFTMVFNAFTMLLQWFSMLLHWLVFNAFTMVFNVFTMLLQWFSMLLQCFSMLLQCFYNGFQCFDNGFQCFCHAAIPSMGLAGDLTTPVLHGEYTECKSIAQSQNWIPKPKCLYIKIRWVFCTRGDSSIHAPWLPLVFAMRSPQSSKMHGFPNIFNDCFGGMGTEGCLLYTSPSPRD